MSTILVTLTTLSWWFFMLIQAFQNAYNGIIKRR